MVRFYIPFRARSRFPLSFLGAEIGLGLGLGFGVVCRFVAVWFDCLLLKVAILFLEIIRVELGKKNWGFELVGALDSLLFARIVYGV